MSGGPFTTITVDEYYKMQDRIRVLENVITAAQTILPPGDPVSRMLGEALRNP